MIYRGIILVSLMAAILFAGALTTYPSPLVDDAQCALEQPKAESAH